MLNTSILLRLLGTDSSVKNMLLENTFVLLTIKQSSKNKDSSFILLIPVNVISEFLASNDTFELILSLKANDKETFLQLLRIITTSLSCSVISICCDSVFEYV